MTANSSTSPAHDAPAQANAMWGGHYAAGPSEAFAAINPSIEVDKRLYSHDIRGSRAHCQMLEKCAIVSAEESRVIQDGLRVIESEIADGKMEFRAELEDIHMHIEARLRELIGDIAGKLHTARSRNDQVATDFKMFTREACEAMDAELRDLQAALIGQAETHSDTIMPGFTHLQSAQPVTFGHHMLAYNEMFARDRGRFSDAKTRLNECPLGAAALAGTGFPIDREMTAQALGFSAPMRNSLDAVSDRDFAIEFLAAASLTAMHLSRLAEELILWVTPQFGFIALPESFTSGSSIMPQKRNPDAAELIRGKSGRIIGALNGLLITMKGLPLAYNKDTQEDKEPVFDAFDNLRLCTLAMRGMVESLTVNKDAMLAATQSGFPTATDLADWLVRELAMPFRDAHHVTGSLVKEAETRNCKLHELPLDIMQKSCADITESIYDVLSVEASLNSRTSFGGTAPANVKTAAQAAKKRLA